MLLEFSCSNHKSIRQKILFSTLAGKDNTGEKHLVNFGDIRVLKSSVIYGANGSGKSNFINAISFVKDLVLQSIKNQPGDGFSQTPHKLESSSSDSEYSLQFVANNVRYAFGFTLNQHIIKEEYLYYFPKGRKNKIYERSGETFETGTKFNGKLTTCKDVLKPNRLLLSCAANFSSVDEIEKAFSFFRDDLVIYDPNFGSDQWMDYSLTQINENSSIKNTVLSFMRGLDLDVRDIDVKIEQSNFPQDRLPLPNFLSDDFKNWLLQEKIRTVRAKLVYDYFETDLMTEESTGIKKLISFLCPLLDIMVKGKTLICDELETSMHEALVHGILKMFMESSINAQAQIIFTTHDTSLLDLDIFRRDQIWFTELKKEDRSTDLFSLAEIKNVRKDKKFGKGYIAGQYGAIPMLNLNFADIVSGLE